MFHFLDDIPSEVYRAYFPDKPLKPEAEDRINAENPRWDNHPVPTLSEKCVRALATFFSVKPVGATHLKGKDRALFMDLLSTQESVKLTVHKIEDSVYWKRCCLSNLGMGLCNVSKHGNSWKRLYCETYVQKLIEKFRPRHTDTYEFREGLSVFEPCVKKLQIDELLPPMLQTPTSETLLASEDTDPRAIPPISSPSREQYHATLMSDSIERIDFSIILPTLQGIHDFSVCYTVKKIGTDFRWEIFGITMKDSINLANGLRSLKQLRSISIKNSKLDDEMMYEIYDGVRQLPHLEILNFPNNLLTDDSVDTLVKVMSIAPVKELDLTNNNIGCEGAKTLAIFLTSGKSQISKVDLSLNNIRRSGCVLLCKAIGLNKELASLDLSSNRLESESCDAIRDMLKLSPTINDLNLSCNRLGKAGGEKLLEGVKASSSLKRLDLRLTGCSRQADLGIQEILKENRKRLSTLELSSSLSRSHSVASSTASIKRRASKLSKIGQTSKRDILKDTQ